MDNVSKQARRKAGLFDVLSDGDRSRSSPGNYLLMPLMALLMPSAAHGAHGIVKNLKPFAT